MNSFSQHGKQVVEATETGECSEDGDFQPDGERRGAGTGKIPNLRVLHIERCGITSLPTKIEQLSNSLQRLNLPGNKLTSLPLELARMRSLQVLDISSNALSVLVSFAPSSSLLLPPPPSSSLLFPPPPSSPCFSSSAEGCWCRSLTSSRSSAS
eukprot:766931-Hanusia_phi.AAC.2